MPLGNLTMSHGDPNEGRYDPTTIWLHWTTVILIVVLWVIGQTADLLPRGPLRSSGWSVHVILGCVLAFVLFTRIAWRAHFGRVLPPADEGVLHAVAKATHYTLYVLLAAVVVTGIANLRSPLIFCCEPNRTRPTTLGRSSFVACHSGQ
jgi:cytochrome b561